jgi:DNA-binding IclR family transcriptional regulator
MSIQESAAPALDRGLQVLSYLAGDQGASVETICQHFAWPRSSVLRLLQVLEAHHAVVMEGRPARYRARKALMPLGSPFQRHATDFQRLLDGCCESTGCTAELFHLWQDHLELAATAVPSDAQVVVRAPIASQIALGRAEAPSLAVWGTRNQRPEGLVDGGSRTELSAATVTSLLRKGRTRGWYECPTANRYGVRRIALPLCECTGRVIGMIAVAQVAALAEPWKPTPRARSLAETARHAQDLIRMAEGL